MELPLPSELPPSFLVEIADEYGTPTYITSASTVRERYDELRDAFPDARIQYAAKANTNPRILEILREKGATVDAVSLGEVVAAKRAGFDSDDIMYTGVNPPEGELEGVLERNVTVNADSFSGLERIADIASDAGTTEIGIRVNPEVGAGHHKKVITGGKGSKFGVAERRVVEAYEHADKLGLNPVGIHMHIGSGIKESEPLIEAVSKLDEIARDVEAAGFELEYFDIGGGLGVPYHPDDGRLDLDTVADGIRDVYDLDARLVIEPGRYLVAESTVLLTRVNTIKERPGNDFVGVDAGFNTLLRPAMYDSYHHITNLSSDDEPPSRNRRRETFLPFIPPVRTDS
ncbi:MAG: diaminopimelate decarboxylase [Halobacteria archaeon]|nr:diaminopimelate decarboxylase [Halobacteria archaeon]